MTAVQSAQRGLQPVAAAQWVVITEADCTAARLTAPLPVDRIGEPVGGVTLAAQVWVPAANNVPAHCRVDGALMPVDTSPTATPINFRVVLPAAWSRRAVQMGGAGIDGVIPPLTGADVLAPPRSSGEAWRHTGATPATRPRSERRGGAPGQDDWALNDEAIRNFGYMQMKKTHDAAMIVIGEGIRGQAAVQLRRGHIAGWARSTDAHLIPKGLPGAGNLLVFDNGGASGYGFANPIAPDGRGAFARATSRVREINPVTLELVWSDSNPRFYSSNISSAQRLPNGNVSSACGSMRILPLA